MGSLFQKSLTDLVKGIRAHPQDVSSYIASCLAEIKEARAHAARATTAALATTPLRAGGQVQVAFDQAASCVEACLPAGSLLPSTPGHATRHVRPARSRADARVRRFVGRIPFCRRDGPAALPCEADRHTCCGAGIAAQPYTSRLPRPATPVRRRSTIPPRSLCSRRIYTARRSRAASSTRCESL